MRPWRGTAAAALFVLLPIMLASHPVASQTPCQDCINAAQNEYRPCLTEAISVDDKNACEVKREAQIKAYEDGVYGAERQDRETKQDVPKENR